MSGEAAWQRSFLPTTKASLRYVHGGKLRKRKTARPLSSSAPIHMVMRSSLAVSHRSFLSPVNRKKIEQIIRSQAKEFSLDVLEFVNAGNHLHLLFRLKDRKRYIRFVRAVCGLIARHVLSAERGSASNIKRNFWDARPFTRVVLDGPKVVRNLREALHKRNIFSVGFENASQILNLFSTA